MRYISIEEIRLPDGWQEKADKLRDQLIAAAPPERKEIIKKNADVWREVKDALSALSHGKCWYCECKEIRSDNPVDHFRPKNRVADCDGHEGYWWLAFDWHNYRFSCTYCNSRRVGVIPSSDHFPLLMSFPHCSLDMSLNNLCCLTQQSSRSTLWFI